MINNIYNNFSEFYSNGPYLNYSNKVASYFHEVLDDFEIKGKKVLDVACGEGNFLRNIYNQGYNCTGIDLSKEMIKIALNKNLDHKMNIDYFVNDMRNFNLHSKFDIITCWFDSLNYILKTDELSSVFKNIYNSLINNGCFIFDMNTIYGLSVIWTDNNMLIQQNNEKFFESHETSYNYENNTAELIITMFKIHKNNVWKKYVEKHVERAYRIDIIYNLLKINGFKEIYYFSSLYPIVEFANDSPRVYFICKK